MKGTTLSIISGTNILAVNKWGKEDNALPEISAHIHRLSVYYCTS